ncbi:sensor histidine kinase [Chitinilyticum aquatile]|uniref:sensor histidine kinase n=1 Tax=Chitinilyticum aquatile TaxID=362520 RepID=UPI0003F644C6|nr:ATP-binding protein [Chitinilyticum aquatile]
MTPASLGRAWRNPFTRYLLLFSLLLSLAMGAFATLAYRDAHRALLNEFRTALRDEISLLEAIYREEGLTGLQQSIQRRAQLEDGQSVYLLMSPLGTSLAGNLPAWPAGVPVRDEASVTFTDPVRGDHVVAEVFLLYGDYRLLVGRHAIYEEVGRQLLTHYLWLSALLFVTAILCSLLFTRLIRRRLNVIVLTTRRIRAGKLQARIPQDRASDELTALTAEINAMLDQQEKLLQYARHTSMAIAHDLRHPLGELRNQLQEFSTQASVSAEDWLALLGKTDQLLGIFAALLRLGRLESGSQPLQLETLDLLELADDAVSLYQPLADDRGGSLVLRGTPSRLSGDRELLFVAISNLLGNALNYGASPIAVEVGDGHLTVRDAGAGVPEALLARLGEPFFRVDSSRSAAGNGLGLALVRAIAEAHRGELQFANAEDGFTATLVLPLQQN